MKIKTLLLWSVTLAALAFASCSGDDTAGSDPTGPGTAGDQLQTVRLYLNVPSTATARVGDPGYPTGEGEDCWDQLAVMIESADNPKQPITADGKSYYFRILSKNDYEDLPLQSGYRWLPIDLVKGSRVHIYGVTYSKGVTGDPSSDIQGIANAGSGSFANLEIPNNYSETSGQIDAAKFLSVATGYYEKDGNREFTVTQPTGDLYDPATMPTMTLTRLAAKIDIQWDAADAYPNYTDVKVTDFTFYNNKDAQDGTEHDNGCLFPDLHKVEGADGHTTFYNTSEISQRNGRVYHYAFPNGSTPEVRFTITSESPGAGSSEHEYTFEFKNKLQKATWYKLNVTIRGNSGNATRKRDTGCGRKRIAPSLAPCHHWHGVAFLNHLQER